MTPIAAEKILTAHRAIPDPSRYAELLEAAVVLAADARRYRMALRIQAELVERQPISPTMAEGINGFLAAVTKPSVQHVERDMADPHGIRRVVPIRPPATGAPMEPVTLPAPLPRVQPDLPRVASL